MAKSKLVKANEKIADKFADNFLTKEGESAADARERLAAEQREREEAGIAEREQRSARLKEINEENRKKVQDAAARRNGDQRHGKI